MRRESKASLAADVEVGDVNVSEPESRVGSRKNSRPTPRKPRRNAKGQLLPGERLNTSGANQYTKRNDLKHALSTLAADVPPESSKQRNAIWKRFIELAESGDPWAVKEYLTRRWAVPARQKDADGDRVDLSLQDYTGVEVRRELTPAPNVEQERERSEPVPRGPTGEPDEEEGLEPEIAQERTDADRDHWFIRRPWEDERPAFADLDDGE